MPAWVLTSGTVDKLIVFRAQDDQQIKDQQITLSHISAYQIITLSKKRKKKKNCAILFSLAPKLGCDDLSCLHSCLVYLIWPLFISHLPTLPGLVYVCLLIAWLSACPSFWKLSSPLDRNPPTMTEDLTSKIDSSSFRVLSSPHFLRHIVGEQAEQSSKSLSVMPC